MAEKPYVEITAKDLTRAAFDSATKNAQAFGNSLTGLFGPLTALTSAAGFGALIRSNIELGAELDKLHKKTGISVEDLSAYQFAAKLSEVSNDQLSETLKKLGNSINDAIVNKGGEAALYFNALGVQVADNTGKARNLGVVFEELAGKLSTVTNEVQRSAAENKLLGKSGSEIDPLINNLGKLKDQAYATGNIISADFAKSADQFQQEVHKMELALKTFLATSQNGPGMLQVLSTALKGIEFVALGLGQGLQELGTQIGGLAAAGNALAHGSLKDAKLILREMNADIAEIQKKGEAARAALFETDKLIKDRPTGGGGTNIDITGALNADKNNQAFFKLQHDLENRVAAIDQSLMTEQQRYEKHALEVNNILGNAMATGVIFQGDADRIREQMELEHQAKMGNASAQGILQRQAFERMTATQQAGFIANTLMQITASAAGHNKVMFEINKAASLANAIINISAGVTKAWAFGPILGPVFAGLIAAAGAIQIQQILQTRIGGSPSLASSGGGVPSIPASSQNVPFIDQNQTGQQRTVQIQILGTIIGNEQFLNEVILPGIRDAVDNADMVIIGGNSRQAQEMRP